MSKQVILTGLRANNDLQLGNYFGALLPMIDMATRRSGEYQINLFVPDLHSFTTPIDHATLQAQITRNLKLFVAAGLPLDNPDIHIYRQSHVPAHSELTWILDCFTGFGEMSRMTQFKEKSAKILGQGEMLNNVLREQGGELKLDTKKHEAYHIQPQNRVSVGLFNYPVLMAADILLYDAVYVPVGDDQTQHLEFTRDIAERLNNKFATDFPDGLFTVPLPVPKQHAFFGKDQGLRIRDLQTPTKKMSKSDELGKGVIFLGDSPEVAAKKVMSAATDSEANIHFDWDKQPGITNLLQILELLEDETSQSARQRWEGKSSYGDLKKEVAEHVHIFLNDFQQKLAQVNETALHAKLETSEAAMRETANRTLLRAQQAVGLRAKA